MEKNKLVLPNKEKKVLLHCCCAPCSGGIIESLLESSIDPTVLFYNPNIHPEKEYEIRKAEIVRFAKKMNIPFVDSDYDQDIWFKRVKGLELEPERGKRCRVCFDIRLERAALFAMEHGFKIFTSNFGISRWKDRHQVNKSGIRAASRYPDLVYWTYNWRQQNGSQRMYETTKHEQFYRQKYCGCIYSLRDADLRSSKERKISDPASKS
ncbi:MAG: epoxyqueuosine reductase QueH [Candidatus Omnitrophica bacterium]|nr:epoxyqueuosine reductase QueH [Candidatus Omnitrophota bacterium]